MANERKPGRGPLPTLEDFVIRREDRSYDRADEDEPTRIGFRGPKPDDATMVRDPRPVMHAPLEHRIEEEPERRPLRRTPSPSPRRELSGTLSARSLLHVVHTEA